MMNRETAAEFLQNHLLGSQDVQDALAISRPRLKALVDEGKLVPIKELKREKLFWAADIEQLKKEMLKNHTSNLYKRTMGVQ